MTETAALGSGAWQRLSLWSVMHFSWRAVAQHLQALAFAGAGTFGAARWGGGDVTWLVPVVLIAVVLGGALLQYHFYGYRLLDDAIEVRRGALFRESLTLAFERIQNVGITHPFYLRPLGRANLMIDAAGADGDEISVPALQQAQAEAIRRYVLARRVSAAATATDGERGTGDGGAAMADVVFTRSVPDLIVHGLTNNRAYFALAGASAVAWQLGLSPVELAAWLGANTDLDPAGLGLVPLVLLALVALTLGVGIIALLSVLNSIFTYYGYAMTRTADGLTVRRGLLTRHEIHVRRSRIQTVTLQQDWLDRCLGRRNILLELVSHTRPGAEPESNPRERLIVPSVRLAETEIIAREVLPPCTPEALSFTPVSIRYLYPRVMLVSVLGAGALLALSLATTDGAAPAPLPVRWLPAGLLVLWLALILRLYLSWRRGGLAVHGDLVVARSGVVGTDYRLFEVHKIQDVSLVQSRLMRPHGLSRLVLHTAATTIRIPHMPVGFLRRVADYCLYRVESSNRSWM